MRKIKVWITVLLIYELIILTILQIHRTCIALFNINFCNANNFKYFLMGFMVPALFLLFVWWIPDISRTICKNKCKCEISNNTYNTNHGVLHNVMNSDEIKNIIKMGVVALAEKLINKIPEKTNEIKPMEQDIKKTKKRK